MHAQQCMSWKRAVGDIRLCEVPPAAAGTNHVKKNRKHNSTAMSSDRTNQRYDGNVRLVAGCVLFRPTDASVPGSPIEVLLVQANKRRDWICPKGGWELHGACVI